MISQPQILDNLKFIAALDLSHNISAGAIVSPDNIVQGEVVVTDMGNVVLDTTTVLNTPIFKIVMGRGAGVPLLESKPIKASEIRNYTITAYQPKVQEVIYYGYNAVSGVGAFDVINNNFYDLNISFQNLWGTDASSLYIPVGGSYQSTATATQEEIVNGLYKTVVANLSRFTQRIAVAERVVSTAVEVAGDTGVTVPSGALSATLPTLAPLIAVGEYIRFATGVTSPVYKVTAVDLVNNIVTWDIPLQVTFTGDVFEVAPVGTDDYGIRVTGVNQPFILDSRPVFLVQFQGGLKNGGSTPIVLTTAPYIGNGTYELCRQEEAASWRNQGILYNYTEFPPISIPTDLNASGVYSMLNLGWGLPNKTMLTTGNFIGNVLIACEIRTVGTPNVYDDNVEGSFISVVDVLDAVATAAGFSSQIANL